jgi:hypothetical protein
MSPPLFSQKNFAEAGGLVHGEERITVEREGQRLVNPIRAWGSVSGSRCPWERADYRGKRRTTACESHPGMGISHWKPLSMGKSGLLWKEKDNGL